VIRDAAGLAAAEAILAVLGTGLLFAFGTWRRLPRWSRPGPALFAGHAGFAAGMTPLVYLGVSPTPVVVGALAAVALGGGWAFDRRRRGQPPAVVQASRAGFAAAAVLAVPVVLLAVRASLKPVSDVDALLDWTLKARMLAGHGGTLIGALDVRYLTGSTYRYVNPEYPLGVPALQAFNLHMFGPNTDLRVLHGSAIVMFAAFMATTWMLLRPRCRPAPLVGGLLLVTLLPSFVAVAVFAQWDFMLALFVTATATSLWLWLTGDGDDRLALAALFAAACLATKMDGIGFAGSTFLIAAGACAWRRRWWELRKLAVAGAAAAATAVPWQIFNRVYGLHERAIRPSPARMLRQTGDLPEIVRRIGHIGVGPHWGWVAPLALGAAVWLIILRTDLDLAVPFVALVAAQVFVLVVAYWNHAIALGPLMGASLSRVIATPQLVCATALPLLLERWWARWQPGAVLDARPIPGNAAQRNAVGGDGIEPPTPCL
jgi:hypothetical protein